MADPVVGAGSAVTTATAATLINQKWSDAVFYAPNNVRGAINFITDTGEQFLGQGGGTFNFPQIAAISATAFAGGGTVTYSANTEATTTVVPTVIYTAVAIYEDVLNTTMTDAVKLYAPALAEGLFQKMEDSIFGQHANTITTVGSSATGYNFLYADFNAGLEQLHANAKDKAIPGKNIYACYHPLQYGNIFGTDQMVNAAFRGDTGAGPAKTGVIGLANGAQVFFTTQVNTQSSAINNLIIVPSWLILGRKNKPKIEMERTQLAVRVIGSTQYGVKVQTTLCGVRHLVQSV